MLQILTTSEICGLWELGHDLIFQYGISAFCDSVAEQSLFTPGAGLEEGSFEILGFPSSFQC